MKTSYQNSAALMFRYMTCICSAVLMVSVLLASCKNENFPNLLKSEYGGTPASYGHAKVLYIIIDGARGNAIKAITPPNLYKLTTNALYTYNALVNNGTQTVTNANSWANQMTGVEGAKHFVTSEDFAGNNLSNYPSFITLLKKTNSSYKTAAFSASAAFADHFTQAADIRETFENNDGNVKSAVVAALKNDNPDLVLAQFHSVETVAATVGYESTTTAYVNAINQVDAYIGEIMTALQSRPNYNAENWLVVITSNKGGKVAVNLPPNSTIYDDAIRNIFTIYYSSKFATKYLPQPATTAVTFDSYAVRYTYANNNFVNATLGDVNLYNLGTNFSTTIQFLIKNSFTGSAGYPTVLSKRAADFNGSAGWIIFLKGNGYTVNTSISDEIAGGNVSDNQWHVITVTMSRLNGVATVKTYTDGKFNSSGTRTTSESIDNVSPLRIGRIPTNGDANPNLLISNLQIYNVAMPDADITRLSCQTNITEAHPYYKNLIGYWPGDESSGLVLKERTGTYGTTANFKLSGPYVWNEFSNYSANLCPPVTDAFYHVVPNAVDVPYQIMQWLGVNIDVSWQLSGRAFSPVYSNVNP